MKGLEHLAAGYREEAADRIAELEETLLELDGRPQDDTLVDRAFRALHTIKGSGSMFGFDDVASFTHEVETVFDAVRARRVPVTRELVGLALESKDLIRSMLEGTAGPQSGRERLVAALRQFLPRDATIATPVSQTEPSVEVAVALTRTYRIRFQPQARLFEDGTNPMGLLAELRSLGRCEVVALADAIPGLAELSPESCYLGWELTLVTDRGEDAIRDVFIFIEDRCELKVEALSGDNLDQAEPNPAGSTSLAPGGAGAALLSPGEPVGKPAARDEAQAGATSAAAQASSTIRVDAIKLDRLVDLVGELVIAQARLTRIASRCRDPELFAVSEDIDRLSTELRDSTLDVRMVPIGTTFSRFKRLVRDLSTELGKEIDLVTDGAETELDKTVIERLGDPLVHLIRNSCDHGIELPEVRQASGKPRRGIIRLSANHSGPNVYIEICDNGAGLNPAAIRAKALERGLIASDAKLSEKELFGLVFLPGFSTAEKVSNLSGRGVGMDVVKRSIEALRGSVTVESAHGKGTTVRIRLPLTLAIIEGLLVAVGDGSYVLPLSTVEECVELTSADVERGHGARVVAVRGELVPYLRLRELFEVSGERPDVEQIAIITHGEGRYGFVVDSVIGQHQTVIKSLGRMCRDVQGLSGATILGDGTIALIVDVPALVQGAEAATARN
ncbi:MAG TPA: chemotaxis protein CheA [Anaeromyxobacteraceae bacterium]|nr:chemotaxis protein CheA [Anaeromyxobacteraceae bacterium]